MCDTTLSVDSLLNLFNNYLLVQLIRKRLAGAKYQYTVGKVCLKPIFDSVSVVAPIYIVVSHCFLSLDLMVIIYRSCTDRCVQIFSSSNVHWSDLVLVKIR